MDCKSCAYWWAFSGKKVVKRTEIDREAAKKGECRRNPIVRTALDGTAFPVSQHDQWCGEYKNFEASK